MLTFLVYKCINNNDNNNNYNTDQSNNMNNNGGLFEVVSGNSYFVVTLGRAAPLETHVSDQVTIVNAVLSDLSLVAQSVLFIIAGYDTTASLLAFSSYLVAKHKDQQQRLRDEVRQIVIEHGELTYQGILEAKLLDACLQGNHASNFFPLPDVSGAPEETSGKLIKENLDTISFFFQKLFVSTLQH